MTLSSGVDSGCRAQDRSKLATILNADIMLSVQLRSHVFRHVRRVYGGAHNLPVFPLAYGLVYACRLVPIMTTMPLVAEAGFISVVLTRHSSPSHGSVLVLATNSVYVGVQIL